MLITARDPQSVQTPCAINRLPSERMESTDTGADVLQLWQAREKKSARTFGLLIPRPIEQVMVSGMDEREIAATERALSDACRVRGPVVLARFPLSGIAGMDGKATFGGTHSVMTFRSW